MSPSRPRLIAAACVLSAAVAAPVVATQDARPHSVSPDASLKVAVSGSGSISVTPPGFEITGPTQWASDLLLARGSSVTLSVTQADLINFLGWSGDCRNQPVNCTLSMSADRTVTAHFKGGAPPDQGPIVNNPGEPERRDPAGGSAAGGEPSPPASPPGLINVIVNGTTFTFLVTSGPATNSSGPGTVTVQGTVPPGPSSSWIGMQAFRVLNAGSGKSVETARKRSPIVAARCKTKLSRTKKPLSCVAKLPKGTWRISMRVVGRGKVISSSPATSVTVR